MEEGNAEKEKADKSSTKRLVRILVIVGIGIPVLVELLTLFNLINVQLFTGGKEQAPQFRSEQNVGSVVEGDTLSIDAGQPYVIHTMKIRVSARHWRYELSLMPADTAIKEESSLRVDSLKLESGKTLVSEQAASIQKIGDAQPGYSAEWELPSGDIPQVLFLKTIRSLGPDSSEIFQKEVPLGNIPIRYARD